MVSFRDAFEDRQSPPGVSVTEHRIQFGDVKDVDQVAVTPAMRILPPASRISL